MDPQSVALGYEIFYIQLFHVFAIILSLSLNFMIWLRSRKTQAVERFMLLQGLFVLWMIAKVLKTVAFNVDLRWGFILLQYCGVCFIGSVFLMFAFSHVYGKPLSKTQELLLNSFPLGMLILVATNPWHHLFYATYDFKGDTFGPAFYAHMVYTYGCIAVGIALILYHSRQRSEIIRRNSRGVDYLLGLGILIPLLFNILYITKTYKLLFGVRPLFDYTPLCYSLSLVIFGFAVFALDLFGAVKPASLETFNSLSQPLAILNGDGKIHLENQAYARVFPESGLPGENLECSYSGRLIEWNDAGGPLKYQATLNPMKRIPFQIPFKILSLVDVTESMGMADSIQNKNQALETANRKLEQHNTNLEELAVKRERIRAARNLHDILGHALVLLISVLETARLCFSRQDTQQGSQRLDSAMAIAEEGLAEMTRTLTLHAQGYRDIGFLEDRIKALGEQMACSGVGMTLDADHGRELVDSEKTETALRAVQEAATNAVRHGRAHCIEVYLRVITGLLVVIIKDDGVGSTNTSEGFGLSQMRTKLEAHGGSLTCTSEPGQGFTLQFSIPL